MRWKWILGIAGGLMVAVIAVIAVVLYTYDFNKFKPYITQAAKEATGRELKIEGKLHPKIGLTPAVVVEGVSFQNASWGSRPDMARIKHFEVQVALLPLISGTLELKRFILVEPDILVETDKSGKSNLEFEGAKKDIPEKPKEPAKKGDMKLPALRLKEVRIEKGKVSYKDGQTGKSTTVLLETLSASAPGPDSPLKLKVKGSYHGETFDLDGTFGPLKALIEGGKPWPIKLTANIVNASFTADGSIKDLRAQRGIDLHLTCKTQDISALQKLTGKPLPVKGPLDFSGRLTDPAPKAYKISDLKVALGESDLSGSLEASLAGKRPNVSAALSSKKMDLRPFAAEGGEAAKPGAKPGREATKPGTKRERLFPNDPLPLEGLTQVDAAVQYRAEQVLLPKLAMNDLTLDLTLKDGHLVVKPLKAGVGGGALDGWVDLEPQGKVAALTALVRIDKLDVGRMLKDLQINETVEGNLDVEMDLRGRGSSVAGIMGELQGKTVMIMGKGKISNTYLELLSGDLSSNIFRLLNPAQKETQQTIIHCFVSGFAIKNGRAETTALVFDTDRMSVVGDGEIDLKTEKLNLGLKPSPKDGAASGATGKITQSLTELATPFRLAGTLAHPSLAVDPTQAVDTASKLAARFGLLGKSEAGAPAGGTSGARDLCAPAIEAAKKGVKLTAAGAGEPQKESPAPAEGLRQIFQKKGEGLQKLFGK